MHLNCDQTHDLKILFNYMTDAMENQTDWIQLCLINYWFGRHETKNERKVKLLTIVNTSKTWESNKLLKLAKWEMKQNEIWDCIYMRLSEKMRLLKKSPKTPVLKQTLWSI